MSGLFLAISLFWVLPVICHTLDVPLQSALLIKGEPVGFRTSTHRHKRSETLNGAVTCKEDEYRAKRGKHCCNKCLAGFMLDAECSAEGMKSKCEPCEKDSYRKSPSSSKFCVPCTDCLTQFGQITLQSCTRINDTVCGCPAGYYKSSSDRKFTCLKCSECENGKPHYQCTADRNAVCICYANFFLDSYGNCRPCKECNRTDHCVNHCPPEPEESKKPKESNAVTVVLACAMGAVFLALVITVVVTTRKKLVSAFQKKSPLPTINVPGSGQLSTPLMKSSSSTGKLDSLPGHAGYFVEESGLQQQNNAQNSGLPLPDITLQTQTPSLNTTQVLYKIIECVPVGRWREFIRRLGVSNHVIETSEQDNRHFKDAQYAMLSFWVENEGTSAAARDSLFKVLREMNLGGVVEKIEESL
ncbi:tumor necrosis factor receptor superfamily member 1A [Bufo bufo]|uniref:tumor necrosis factor receptor superfamily member 1A n=1 Tax=Bufo bufo TaxID=8384 RepID=UPI001ABE9B43|nr:tumor necrosis factor receptor superfamily member 1A [Bufo bufo]